MEHLSDSYRQASRSKRKLRRFYILAGRACDDLSNEVSKTQRVLVCLLLVARPHFKITEDELRALLKACKIPRQ